MDWFKTSYPNVPLNRDDVPFSLQCITGIQGTKPDVRQWNILLYAVVKIIIYKKNTIDCSTYIKAFSGGTLLHFIVNIDDVINTTNN